MGRKKLPAKPPKAPAPPKEGAYGRFAEMTTEQQTGMDTMLLRGDSPQKVATVLQEDWGYFKDTKYDTLVKQVQRYRSRVLQPRQEHALAKVAVGAVGDDAKDKNAQRKMHQRLDVMGHWEEIVKLQRERIMKMYEREKGLPVVTDGLTKLFKDYQHGLSALADLQLETGYLKRAPKTVTGTFGFGGDPSDPAAKPVFEVAFELHQDQRSALAELADLTREAIEGECTRVEPSGS
ncbi:MAG TPA: hypothetical protein VGD46_13480 [Rhizobacter sp.]